MKGKQVTVYLGQATYDLAKKYRMNVSLLTATAILERAKLERQVNRPGA